MSWRRAKGWMIISVYIRMSNQKVEGVVKPKSVVEQVGRGGVGQAQYNFNFRLILKRLFSEYLLF